MVLQLSMPLRRVGVQVAAFVRISAPARYTNAPMKDQNRCWSPEEKKGRAMKMIISEKTRCNERDQAWPQNVNWPSTEITSV
jgi:hypothetical protein